MAADSVDKEGEVHLEPGRINIIVELPSVSRRLAGLMDSESKRGVAA